MLDEHFGINATNLDVKKSIIRGEDEEDKKAAASGEPPKIDTICIRSDQDLVIDDLRDLNFVATQSILMRRIIDVDSIMKEKNNYQNVDDLQNYIERLKNMKLTQVKDKLPHHTNLAHYINSQISNFDYSECLKLEQTIIEGEDIQGIVDGFNFLMARGVDRDSVLRLFVLFSITQSGLKKSIFEELYNQYVV